jgi:DNA-directed RNA polymerase alpha subunit
MKDGRTIASVGIPGMNENGVSIGDEKSSSLSVFVPWPEVKLFYMLGMFVDVTDRIDKGRLIERASPPLPDNDDGLKRVLSRLPDLHRTRVDYLLRRSGISRLDQISRLSNDDLCAFPGVGSKTAQLLRQAINEEEWKTE